MKSASGRWLLGAVVLLVAVLVAGIALALLNERRVDLFPETSPEGTVQRYLIALEKEDYKGAYEYFAASVKEKCRYDSLLRRVSDAEIKESQVVLEKTKALDKWAEVTVTVSRFRASGPFSSSEHAFKQTFHLVEEESGWRLSEIPWPIWWCERPEPAKAPAVP